MTTHHTENEENGTGSNGTALAGLPWWLRGVYIVGIVGGIALYLTYIMAQALPTKIDNVQMRVDEVKAIDIQHGQSFENKWDDQDVINKELISVMRATCINAAKNDEARNRCLGR